jgi:hypothetical protein
MAENSTESQDWLDKLEALKAILKEDPNLSQASWAAKLGFKPGQASYYSSFRHLFDQAAIDKIRQAAQADPSYIFTYNNARALIALKSKVKGHPEAIHPILDLILTHRMATRHIEALARWVKVGKPIGEFDHTTVPYHESSQKDMGTPSPSPLTDANMASSLGTGLVQPDQVVQEEKHSKNTEAESESFAMDLLIGIPIISRIKSKYKKNEKINFWEYLFLIVHAIGEVLFWVWKRVLKPIVEKIWHGFKEAVKALFKILGKISGPIVSKIVSVLVYIAIIWGIVWTGWDILQNGLNHPREVMESKVHSVESYWGAKINRIKGLIPTFSNADAAAPSPQETGISTPAGSQVAVGTQTPSPSIISTTIPTLQPTLISTPTVAQATLTPVPEQLTPVVKAKAKTRKKKLASSKKKAARSSSPQNTGISSPAATREITRTQKSFVYSHPWKPSANGNNSGTPPKGISHEQGISASAKVDDESLTSLEMEIAAIPRNLWIKDYAFEPDTSIDTATAILHLSDLQDASKYTLCLGRDKQKVLTAVPSSKNLTITFQSGLFGGVSKMDFDWEDVKAIHCSELDSIKTESEKITTHSVISPVVTQVIYQLGLVMADSKRPLTVQCATAGDMKKLVSALEFWLKISGRRGAPLGGLPYPTQGLRLNGDAIVTTLWADSPAGKSGINFGDLLWSLDQNELKQQLKGDLEAGLKFLPPGEHNLYVVTPAEWKRVQDETGGNQVATAPVRKQLTMEVP